MAEMRLRVLVLSESSQEFHQGMVDRMDTSYHKYGKVRDTFPSHRDAIADLEKRLEKYADTGNTEWLIDAANYAMIEFMAPAHPNAHYRATASEESPGTKLWTESESTTDLRKLTEET